MNSKTYEIQETVEWLKGRFGPSLVVVDHWESDMAATGLAIESQPDRLVYIATEAPPNTYFVELETAPSMVPNYLTQRLVNFMLLIESGWRLSWTIT